MKSYIQFDRISRNYSIVVLLCIVVIFSLVFSNCGPSRPRRAKTPERVRIPPPPPKPPEIVKIVIQIRNWTIRDHRILNWSYADFGRLIFSGRFIMNEKLVFKFDSDKVHNYYWLAYIPSQMQGQVTLSAQRYRDAVVVTKLSNPPKNLTIL